MTLQDAPTHGQTLAVAVILALVVLTAVAFTIATLIAIRLDRRDEQREAADG